MKWGRKTEPKPSYRLGTIEIAEPWARAATLPGPEREAGGYFIVTNTGTAPDRLLRASSPAVGEIEIHAIKVVGSNITMRPLEKGLGLPAATTLTLKPRGYHLLMRKRAAPLVPGTRLPVTLTFETAGDLAVELAVEPTGPVGDECLVVPAQPG